MDILNDLKERAVDLAQAGAELAQAGVAKSKQLAEIGRLNVNNASEEAAIRKAYTEIGKLYYAERGMSPDVAYQALCEKITASKVTIEENKARIAELKEASGVTDEDFSPVETDVPPEEPVSCGCCCDAPAEEAPVETEETHAEETPVEEAPVDAPADDTPTDGDLL